MGSAVAVLGVTVPDGGDADALIHSMIERTLAAGGKIRQHRHAEPDLDDLFAQYISRPGAAA